MKIIRRDWLFNTCRVRKREDRIFVARRLACRSRGLEGSICGAEMSEDQNSKSFQLKNLINEIRGAAERSMKFVASRKMISVGIWKR